MKNLVIVESPNKVKTIENFLGAGYKVTSSRGHIRDLKKHDFSIDLDNDYKPEYEIPEDKKVIVAELKKNAKEADMVWLASDEDREGEAISWHLSEVLGLTPENSRRIVFHEITKPAILHAIENPRSIDMSLVNAQQARRVLDRIVGFELSPILWRKVKPQLSAGRVQSVVVRLIVEREREIEKFNEETSFRIDATFTIGKQKFSATLAQNVKTVEEAEKILASLHGAECKVTDVQQKCAKRVPAPPFTTSTLQQEAARKLHFSVSQTMSVAQRLYEAGMITYMRTDSVNLSTLALGTCKEQILKTMGEKYLHTHNYQTHSKGAQEAHEAIRPTYIEHTEIEGTTAEKRLYELIWKRTIASQMADAETEKTTVEIEVGDKKFTSTGEVIRFDGFLKVYMEGKDEDENNDEDDALPAMNVGDVPTMTKASAVQRYSMHPQRYTEGSMVKKMEELGIGRPSTYGPTISTIQQREYVTRSDRPVEKRNVIRLALDSKGAIKRTEAEETYCNDKGKLIPTDIGIVVNDFLTQHFPDIMSYNFTADVEKEFDEIAEGNAVWDKTIDKFYKLFHPMVAGTLEERNDRKAGERVLGKDPKTGNTVSVKISRFGAVVQIGTPDEVSKPQFAPLAKGQSIQTITLDEALHLFDLPKELGVYNNVPIIVGIGKFGPYLRQDKTYTALPKEYDPHKVTLEEAIKVISSRIEEVKNRELRTFTENADLKMLNGKFGPYLQYKGKNYKLPKNKNLEAMTYEECMAIVEGGKNKE